MRKGQKRLIVNWLCLVACAFAALIISYLYLHDTYRTATYFWQSGEGQLAEILFWSLSGALLPVFISGVQAVKKATAETSLRIIAFQCLQIIAAPLFALILFAGVYYRDDPETSDGGFTILAFVAGLFSGQLLLLFKSLVTSYHPEEQPAIAAVSPGNLFMETDTEVVIPAPVHTPPVKPKLPDQVTAIIYPELDDAGLYEDVKNEVLRKGFGTASVTLQLQQSGNGEIVTAVKKGDGKGVAFIADGLSPGTYTIRGMHLLKLKDNTTLCLFAERTEDLDREEVSVRLFLRKLEV